MTMITRLRVVWALNVAFLGIYWAIGGPLREIWIPEAGALDPERRSEIAWLAPILAFGAACTVPGVRRFGIRYGPACLLAWGFAEGVALVGLVLWINGAPASWFGVASALYLGAMAWLFPTAAAMHRHDAVASTR